MSVHRPQRRKSLRQRHQFIWLTGCDWQDGYDTRFARKNSPEMLMASQRTTTIFWPLSSCFATVLARRPSKCPFPSITTCSFRCQRGILNLNRSADQGDIQLARRKTYCSHCTWVKRYRCQSLSVLHLDVEPQAFPMPSNIGGEGLPCALP